MTVSGKPKRTPAPVDDPRFPYSNWLLKHVDTEEKHARVHAVLHVLTSRVMGESPKNVERLRLGLPPGLANGQGPPTKGEILDALKYGGWNKVKLKTLFLQLELTGLGRIGSNPFDILQRNIPGYRMPNERPTMPSRYFGYE